MEEQCLECKHLRPLTGGCAAFPDGIPYEISSGQKLHDTPVPGQTGTLVFTKGEPDQLAKLK